MSARPLTKLSTLAARSDGQSTDDDVRRLILRWIVVVGQAVTLLVTYRLWQVREAVPHLPMFDVLDSMQFAPLWPLLASLVVVLARPLIGIALHSTLLLVAIALDQMRIQPEVISMAILLWGTLAWRGAGMIARAHLISLWFYAGFHKAVSPAYWDAAGTTGVERTFPEIPQLLAWAITAAVPLTEMALAALILWPRSRKIAAWSACALHVVIFLSLALSNWNQAVWAWNLVLAAAGPLMFAWWRESTWADLRASRRVVQAAIVFLLISPAGYYLGWIDAYLAHCLYASNTPTAEIVPYGEDASKQLTRRLLGYQMIDELNVPFPPTHRLYEQYFDRIKLLGDQMRIIDRRRWAHSRGWSLRWLSCDGERLKGQKQGLWIEWHSNRRKSRETMYVDGKKHGRYLSWYLDGKPSEEGLYQNGLEHGQWTVWDDDGKPWIVTYENGKPVALGESQRKTVPSPLHSP